MSRFDVGASRGMRRLRLGLGVGLLSILALVALYFVLGLSEDPSLRWRHDFSEVGRNSLDASTQGLLEKLEDEVTAHVFFRRENSALDQAREEARSRVLDLLLVASKLAPDRFKFRIHDLSDLATAAGEMQRLGVSEVNTVVLEEADRHVILRLEPDFCELGRDPMDPRRVTVASFRGEEALVDGLLKVAAENRPKVLFSNGHGERDPESEESEGIGALTRALAGDGFDLGIWNGTVNGPLGDDVDILAIVGPEDPFSEEEVRLIRAFVDRGGRLLVAQGSRPLEGARSAGGLLAPYGMLARPGLVCIPTLSQDLGAMTTGIPACAQFQVQEAGLNSSHPITKPIWEAARKVAVLRSASFERSVAPAGGTLQDLLVQRNRHAWLDLPDARGRYDYSWDLGNESSGAASLAMATEFPVGELEARVIGLGTSNLASNFYFGDNRDFLMNCFNWLADREFNVRVALRPDERTVIDVVRGTEILWLRRFAWYGLPGLLAAVGLLLAWLRKR